jgi:hypothetical protein
MFKKETKNLGNLKPKQQWKPTKRRTNKLQKINETFNEIKNT